MLDRFPICQRNVIVFYVPSFLILCAEAFFEVLKPKKLLYSHWLQGKTTTQNQYYFDLSRQPGPINLTYLLIPRAITGLRTGFPDRREHLRIRKR